MKKTIFSMILLLAGCLSASAQETKMVEVFNPHWYVGGQFGMQHTLGEISASKLNSLNAQINGGYQITPLWGVRLAVGAWQSKGGVVIFPSKPEKRVEFQYKWNYIAPNLDVTFNVTNLFGFNPKRIVDVNIFAGIGCNIAWNNGEANDVRNEIISKPEYYANMTDESKKQYMTELWTGTTARPVGRLGLSVDFKVCKRVSIGLEANANFLNETYNSKYAGNVDWYFNGLAGVKVALGKTTKMVPVPVPVSNVVSRIDTVYIEKKEIVHDTIYVQASLDSKSLDSESIRRDIFFTIANSEVSKAEMPKVEDLAAYLKRHPKAKITITGYADKGTGSAKANIGYAMRRAQIVTDILVSKFGIARNRIIMDSKGDTVQPYKENDLNRVSICIAE